MRILYDSKNLKFKKPFGVLFEDESCSLAVYIPHYCKTNSVYLKIKTESLKDYCEFPFEKWDEDQDYEIFRCNFSLKQKGLYFYCFYIKTENEEFTLYKKDFADTNMEEGEFWQLSVIEKDFCVPNIYKGGIMYQIFPDRFFKANGVDAKNKLEPYYIHNNVKEIPHFLPNEEGEVLNNDFYGGNLLGITKKLPYLKKLGVNIIYLNPIFKAYSNHRYDTCDYKKIDELLGSEQDFKNLCKKAHKLNIKIILDGVFSHTGSRSIYFDIDNTFKGGAYHNKDSKYYNWFLFKNWPDDYTAWWGIKTLPCVNELNQDYINYIIEDEDSVISHWLNLGADGFRLDVADELPDEFIKRLRTKLKSINKNSLLIGEVWEDASNKISYNKRREYFTSGELDSVMNYPFKDAIINFVLKKISSNDFMQQIMNIVENYPKDVVLTLMNILSTHDTVRILTELSGIKITSKEERAKFKLKDTDLALAIKRLKVAAFLQFMLPGITSIYYGDEIGTQGFEDPFCRSFFDWEKTKNNDILKFYKKLTALKNKYAPIKYGDINFIKCNDDILVFKRTYKGKDLTAAINLSNTNFTVNAKGAVINSNAKKEKNKIIIKPFGFALF